ncbi:hypothetical protein C1645_873238 [Glomus cerebriforme]|uniref:Attractin/MKLN-like beta-propeller domain-containing protein n=1 Tax=Glomus cerebriforme TaxID=658196 RepID=A0A397TA83_9GLOM|nr:hypothetical protein C1645_873238 [Glomus cerebriforme]
MIRFHIYFLIFNTLLFTASIYAQYSSTARYAHASILIDSKLYFIGGFDSSGKMKSDFFYLDLSIQFSSNDVLKFIQINNNDLTPNAWCNAATTNNIIYLLGCFMINDNSSLIYQYSISSNKWSIPSISGTPSPAHRIKNGVSIDHSTGRIYYFGGEDDANKLLNDMWILYNINNNQLSWQQLTPALQPSCCSSAVLLPDGYILYIGGRNNDPNNDPMRMNNITRYNTISNTWDFVKTTGVAQFYRLGFSAVLVPDGRIIVYGGMFPGVQLPSNDLNVLNTTTYEWMIPEVRNKQDTKSFHTANLYDNYMIVAFGIGTDNTPSSEILLLDITDITMYKWIPDFIPTSNSSNGNNENNGKKNVSKIIGAVIGSVVGIVSICLLSFFGYKFYKKRNNKQEISRNVIDNF